MPDSRQHRGPHPRDSELFAKKHVAALRRATADLSWLLTREYSALSALKLVGDRHALTVRQRQAVLRSACSDAARTRRAATRSSLATAAELWIDGFNVLLTIEAALGGAPVFRARDDCLRDLGSVHGTYRRVSETTTAIGALARVLHEAKLQRVRVLLDAPVSNSGRLAALLREQLSPQLEAEVELLANPDTELASSPVPVATADSAILDRAHRWVNLACDVVEQLETSAAFRTQRPWIVDLSHE